VSPAYQKNYEIVTLCKDSGRAGEKNWKEPKGAMACQSKGRSKDYVRHKAGRNLLKGANERKAQETVVCGIWILEPLGGENRIF